MKRLIISFITGIILCLFLGVNTTVAQTDSTEYEIYDVIYLTKGGSLKGEILSFNEFNGLIVFKDNNGRKYSL